MIAAIDYRDLEAHNELAGRVLTVLSTRIH